MNLLRFTSKLFKKTKLKIIRKLIWKVDDSVEIEHLGSVDCGWSFCPNGLNTNSIVYSLGIGTDITFDLEIINKYGVNLFAFDPTPSTITWLSSEKLPNSFHFFPYAIADFDGQSVFFPPADNGTTSYSLNKRKNSSEVGIMVDVKSIKTILAEIGHHNIDIIKMDIEGAEYCVISELLRSSINFRQLLVEFHHRYEKEGLSATNKLIRKLRKAGYSLYYVSSANREFSFLRK